MSNSAQVFHSVPTPPELSKLLAQYAQIRHVPPRPLTIPAIFGKQHKENFITDYLAYVLNPNHNGLGTAPLAKLFEVCCLDVDGLPLEDVRIYREYSLFGGRIDLLLEWEDTFIIGIENKINALENEGQTPGYASAIAHINKNIPYQLLFLTRRGDRPTSEKFLPLSYAQLWTAFKEITPPTTIHPRQEILWHDFLEHIEVYIMSNLPDSFTFSDKSQLYLEHNWMIEDLRKTFNQEWKQAIEYIAQRMSAQLVDDTWKFNFNSSVLWQHIYKPSWLRPDLSVHLEFFFSPQMWQNGRFPLMLDAEQKQAASFLELFDKRQLRLQPEYERKNIQYRPSRRKHAVAWKEFQFEQNIDQVVQTFWEAFQEFRFLENEIDATIAEWDLIQLQEASHV